MITSATRPKNLSIAHKLDQATPTYVSLRQTTPNILKPSMSVIALIHNAVVGTTMAYF